jgi:hypothetical protein
MSEKKAKNGWIWGDGKTETALLWVVDKWVVNGSWELK